jgi:lipoprotein-anchoring transpeptidase ErfK/SrfK
LALHTAPKPPRKPSGPLSRRALYGWVAAGIAVVLALVIGFATLGGAGGTGAASSTAGPAAGAAVAAPPDAAADVFPTSSDLPLSSTYTTVAGAPKDTAPGATTDGIVVHPVRETPVHDAPNGRAIARMDTTQFGDAWLPVIAQQDGWVQVLLPSKPNRSTGWLRSADVRRATTPYVIRVHLKSMRLELTDNGEVTDTWTVGTGKAAAPTPTGRTFLLGAFSDIKQKYSPVILPLGTHSPTHDTFGGGPGTVAIHTWPTSDVYGTASSDGCIRVPADALTKLSEVPLGTLVMIDEE